MWRRSRAKARARVRDQRDIKGIKVEKDTGKEEQKEERAKATMVVKDQTNIRMKTTIMHGVGKATITITTTSGTGVERTIIWELEI